MRNALSPKQLLAALCEGGQGRLVRAGSELGRDQLLYDGLRSSFPFAPLSSMPALENVDICQNRA